MTDRTRTSLTLVAAVNVIAGVFLILAELGAAWLDPSAHALVMRAVWLGVGLIIFGLLLLVVVPDPSRAFLYDGDDEAGQ